MTMDAEPADAATTAGDKPVFRPDQLLGARFDTPDLTGRLINFEAWP